MTDISGEIFFNFFIFLFVPFILALFFKKNKISPLIGYMIGGMILSNLLGGLTSTKVINDFAYFGIILLLFTIGLEIQFEKMIAIKKFIVLGGILQIFITIFFATIISLLFGFSAVQSLLIGIALSSSSTTLVAKIIQDKGEENSFHGEIALGILMFQDLAFIPFVIIFNSITFKEISVSSILIKIFVDCLLATLLLVVAYYGGKIVIPPIFNRIARVSRELLNLFIIIFIFFVGYISTLLHLPILISIFVAGILIGQTVEHYHIFSQIRPLRDLLAIIFFIFIGTTIKVSLALPMVFSIFLFCFLIIFIKALVILVIFLSFRFSSKLSFYLSLYLFQIDEDAFILMSVAYLNKMFSQSQYVFIVAAVLLSLVMTPLLISNKEKIYIFLRKFFGKYLPFMDQYIKHKVDFAHSPIDVLTIRNHIVICGYGRIGAYIGRALMLSNIPFVAVDYNFHIVENAKKQGVSVIYGDPTDIDILDYAEVEHATALILALPNRHSQEQIVFNAKKLNPNVVIISRVHQKLDQQRMRDLGVDVVIQPEFEASISMLKKILFLKKIDRNEIIKKLHYFKLDQEGI